LFMVENGGGWHYKCIICGLRNHPAAFCEGEDAGSVHFTCNKCIRWRVVSGQIKCAKDGIVCPAAKCGRVISSADLIGEARLPRLVR
ncbi:hypothetical protein PENTCL1PPCAC_7348, partial [Pristionchus entomophagus]